MISSTYTAAHNHPQLQFWGSSLSSEPHRHQAHISHSIYTCRQNIHTQFLKKLNHWKSLSMNKGLWWFEFCASQSITKEYLKLGSWREGSAVEEHCRGPGAALPAATLWPGNLCNYSGLCRPWTYRYTDICPRKHSYTWNKWKQKQKVKHIWK